MNKSLSVVWEFEVESNKYSFVVPYKSTYSDAYKALEAIAKDLQNSEKEAIEYQKSQEKPEASPEVAS